ncbi:Holliday junction resolvase RuvX [Oceanithermus sp.]
MKLLGLDVGDSRIGLAVTETGQPFAFGRGWLQRKGNGEDVSAILELARSENVDLVVVGLPLLASGEEGTQAAKVRDFVKELRSAGLRVELSDERFTTRLAQQRLEHLPRKKKREKGRLDEAAAVAILEGFLERWR